MDVKIILKNCNLEILEKILPRLIKIAKENPDAVMHVEAEIG